VIRRTHPPAHLARPFTSTLTRAPTLALASLLALALLVPPSARADEPPDPRPARPTSFGATPAPSAPTAEVAPDDFEGLLRNCDIVARNMARELAACRTDAVGVDFLAAAYLALWAILMGFFFVLRLRQRRLVEEIRTLRERLARLGDDGPGPQGQRSEQA
jgi:hypothetical protein